MMSIIRSINEDAWTAPTKKTETGTLVIKSKPEWTEDDKRLSKFNSKAINCYS